MKKQTLRLLTVALALGALVFAAPLVSQAATITNVTVTMGGTTWCASGCVNNIWAAGIGAGVNITGNQALILTQTAAFNFDTSEVTGIASITVTQLGAPNSVFTDNANILANFNNPDTGTNQEASEWTLPTINTLNGIRLWIGYADTAHPDPFTDGTGGNPANGVPDNPWPGSGLTPGSTFIGAAGGVQGGSSCNRLGVVPCFDAGALRIEAVAVQTPEPSILLLMGVGLVGIGALSRKKAKN